MIRFVGAWVLAALAAPALHAQDSLDTIVTRAAQYVAQYQRDLALVVAEEKYEQEARYSARALNRYSNAFVQRTTLRSDFLLVRGPDGSWMPFRDVFERDGAAVRDRDQRLARLFLDDSSTAIERARKIVDESARYNVGTISRNINLPTLALLFLTDRYRTRFEFVDKGREDNARVVQYRELGRPTYVSTTNGRDLPVSGRYWIDEATGRVERSELVASDSAIEARIEVTYRDDESAGLWVPARMKEAYKQRDDGSEVTGTATYSRFRRFQVTTIEDLAK